ncbi:unnamed protein product [Gadus morhua 'NCC']
MQRQLSHIGYLLFRSARTRNKVKEAEQKDHCLTSHPSSRFSDLYSQDLELGRAAREMHMHTPTCGPFDEDQNKANEES